MEKFGQSAPAGPERKPATHEQASISVEALKAYKNDVEMLLDNFGRLNGVLRNRQDEGYSELIEESSFSRIYSVMRQIRDIEPKSEQDLQELSGNIGWMVGRLREFGEARSRNFKDSADSLKTVTHALAMIGENAGDVARDLKNMGTPEAQEASAEALRLANAAFDARSAVWRRMDQLESR